ncbi:NUDIX domain-containing protein [Nonomuraea sediminis]|uniref:NUDIX domain-containing protein n=1 Tax=Nonomuraea sediminis TaxID=2835864 RepID=UPI001BDC57B5|nr:NUDIX hydrolase [Nonomuraea sediminis]
MHVRDTADKWEVVSSTERLRTRLLKVTTEAVRMPDGDVAERDLISHPGSVTVVALDERGYVLLLRQYRHAVKHLLWELPAGLRDRPGEPLVDLAARELEEEAGYRADTWHTLLDLFITPGASDERSRIFLARGLSAIPEEEITFVRQHEEADMPTIWMPLQEAVEHVLAGMIHNSPTAAGILAAYAASAEGFARLRPADAPEE